MSEKVRLDIVLFRRGLAPSREKAQAMIMAGEVLVDGRGTFKPGIRISPEADVRVKEKPRFVSRGGEKLDAALSGFGLNVTNRVGADVGASTGGFTDCLLQHGVRRVYAIDVGYGQLDFKLRQDPRVRVMERTNARYVESLPESVNLIVADVAFISLRLLLPVMARWLAVEADAIVLIKPQFEAGRFDVGKGGVVRDRRVHVRVLQEIMLCAQEQGFAIRGLMRSPLRGPAGNVEFLAWLDWGRASTCSFEVSSAVERVVAEIDS